MTGNTMIGHSYLILKRYFLGLYWGLGRVLAASILLYLIKSESLDSLTMGKHKCRNISDILLFV